MPDDEAFDGPRRRAGFAGPTARAVGRGSERTLAAVAHAAIGFGLLGIGFLLSLAITAVIWLVGRRSPFIEEQADRAGRNQFFVLLTNVLIVVVGLGAFVLLDLRGWWSRGGARAAALLLVLLGTGIVFVLWYVGSIGYGLYAALRVLGGHDFHYPAHPFRRRHRAGLLDRPLRWEE